jgi:glutamate-ammonia-ligase adenylyltransferase
MRHDIWEPGTRVAYERLAEAAVLPRETAQALIEAYQTLRRIEGILRRVDDTSVSKLPTDERELARIARRGGYAHVEAFREAYDHARETIRAKAVF